MLAAGLRECLCDDCDILRANRQSKNVLTPHSSERTASAAAHCLPHPFTSAVTSYCDFSAHRQLFFVDFHAVLLIYQHRIRTTASGQARLEAVVFEMTASAIVYYPEQISSKL